MPDPTPYAEDRPRYREDDGEAECPAEEHAHTTTGIGARAPLRMEPRQWSQLPTWQNPQR